jgi:hypothetical protein
MARTINVQFAGNWAPVVDVVIDKVGKYAYTMGLPNDPRTTPVIMDVSLDVRTKVQPLLCRGPCFGHFMHQCLETEVSAVIHSEFHCCGLLSLGCPGAYCALSIHDRKPHKLSPGVHSPCV